MKRVVCTMLPILAIALVIGLSSGTALAQGDNSDYFVTYYSNANTAGAPDATLRFINDGNTGVDLCAAIYVFDDSEELQECCSCPVSPDGLIAESVNKQLLANSLTQFVNHRGAIKVVSTAPTAGFPECDPTTRSGAPTTGIRGWATHIQKGTAPAYPVTEEEWSDSNLSAAELTGLQEFCQFALILGSGRGSCNCTASDHAF